MRTVIQRVNHCDVNINNVKFSSIGQGLLILLGIKNDDTIEDMDYLIDKVFHLRIFEDEQGKMNKSITDIQGEIMVVSQFTLYGDCKKGRRPSFIRAAKPEIANSLYDTFVDKLMKGSLKVQTGIFGADMQVELENDGPVTILLDSEKQF